MRIRVASDWSLLSFEELRDGIELGLCVFIARLDNLPQIHIYWLQTFVLVVVPKQEEADCKENQDVEVKVELCHLVLQKLLLYLEPLLFQLLNLHILYTKVKF